MHPILVWLRTHPQERLALLGAALVGVFLVVGLCHRSAGSGGVVTPAPASSTGTVARPTAPPSAAPTSPPVGSQPEPASLAAAEQVVRAFLGAYVSSRYDDTPQAMVQRMSPYATSAFLSTFAATATVSQLSPDRHEVAAGTVTQLVPLGFDVGGQLGFAALVTQTVTGDAGQSSQTGSIDVYLVEASGGWRVNQLSFQHIQG